MRFTFELTGATPLLMHADDVLAADTLVEWRKNPDNKNRSKPGDDRSPAWTWQTYLNHDGKEIVIPGTNLMVSLRQAAATIKIKGNKTFKSESQSAIQLDDVDFPLTMGNGECVSMESINAIDRDAPFVDHYDTCKKLGFVLDVRRAKVGQSKHVRVRPKFEAGWSIKGSGEVVDCIELTKDVLMKMFEIAGRSKGLGDWRPSAPQSPGPYGRFSTKIKCE